MLTEAGFSDVSIEPTRIYRLDAAKAFLAEGGPDVGTIPPEVDGAFMSGFVRATKPRKIAAR